MEESLFTLFNKASRDKKAFKEKLTYDDVLKLKEILERTDGKIGQSEPIATKETRIIIIRDGDKTQTVSRPIHIQQEQIPRTMVELGNGQDPRLDIAGNALQRADTQ